MDDSLDGVPAFWQWFSEHRAELLEIVSGQRQGRVTDLIDRALEASALALTYEVIRGAEGAELTFTPEGDPGVAGFIDYFVSRAPALPGWTIHARVPRTSAAAALAFVRALYGIDIADAHFKLVIADDRYHLCFLHDGLVALPEEQRFLVASTFLDHALGERLVMEVIGQLDFRPSGPGIQLGLLVNELICATDHRSPTADLV